MLLEISNPIHFNHILTTTKNNFDHSKTLHFIRITKNEEHNNEFANTTFEAYKELFKLIQDQHLGKIARIWNYIPKILSSTFKNTEFNDRERYRQFNIGRYNAWKHYGPRDQKGEFLAPAATGIGIEQGPLIIDCIISSHPVFHLENPRQTKPINYPSCYGSKAPLFSRATLLSSPNEHTLYLSGTGSIINSETIHTDNPTEQVNEIFRNIEALISHKNFSNHQLDNSYQFSDFSEIKVYIKNKDHYPVIQKQIESIISNPTIITYINTDLCRQDLLLEIEGILNVPIYPG